MYLIFISIDARNKKSIYLQYIVNTEDIKDFIFKFRGIARFYNQINIHIVHE